MLLANGFDDCQLYDGVKNYYCATGTTPEAFELLAEFDAERTAVERKSHASGQDVTEVLLPSKRKTFVCMLLRSFLVIKVCMSSL